MLPTRRLASLAAWLMPLAGAAAFEPAMVPEPPPAPRFQVRVQEGVLGSEPSGRATTLEGATRGDLWLRLLPPGRGRHAPLPSLAAARHGNVIQAWEVPHRLHAPRLPVRGRTSLGPLPLNGEYDLLISLEGIAPAAFRLSLSEDAVELRAMEPGGRLSVASPRLQRLPRGTFTYRFDHPHCGVNRVMVRRLWRQLLTEEPKVGAHPVVSSLLWPATNVSDPTFLDWIEGGQPLMLALEPARVLELLRGMARDTCANLQVRWYGGPLWDSRDIRRGILPDPHWLANLELPRGGPYRPDVFSPDRDDTAHERWPAVVPLGHRYGLESGPVRLPSARITSVLSPDLERPVDESALELSDEDLELDLDL